MLFSPQIPLPLESRAPAGLNEFVAGPNEPVVKAVGALAREPDQSLLLSGPPGSGKTHLLNAACLEARSVGRTAFYLGLKRQGSSNTAALQGLESMDLVCLDDLDRVAGIPEWEEGLFHFINRLRAHRGSLMVASAHRLSSLDLGLPDLASRLAWGLRLRLEPLDDEQKAQVLRRRGESLGIDLSNDVLTYLLARGPRDMSTLTGMVTQLQQAAFREKRQITVPLLRRILSESDAK